MESSIVDLILEIGYSFTSSYDECRNALLCFVGSNQISDCIDSLTVAKIIAIMARTHNSHNTAANENQAGQTEWNESSINTNTWNVDVFVQVIQDQLPNLSWKDVLRDLDQPEFILKDKQSLKIVVQAFKRALKETPFPIELIYRVWNNIDGQLSWLNQSLKHPDVFCFADYPCKRTATECLKAQPEDDNRLISSWRSINLIELLLNLSELGVYSNCIELFKFPITHCPDLLLLGLLQITVSYYSSTLKLLNL